MRLLILCRHHLILQMFKGVEVNGDADNARPAEDEHLSLRLHLKYE